MQKFIETKCIENLRGLRSCQIFILESNMIFSTYSDLQSDTRIYSRFELWNMVYLK